MTLPGTPKILEKQSRGTKSLLWCHVTGEMQIVYPTNMLFIYLDWKIIAFIYSRGFSGVGNFFMNPDVK